MVRNIVRSSRSIKVILTAKQLTVFVGKFHVFLLLELSIEPSIELLQLLGVKITENTAIELVNLVGRMPLALQIIGTLLNLSDRTTLGVIFELQTSPISFLSPEELPEMEQVQTSIHMSYKYLSRGCQLYARLLANFHSSFTKEAAVDIIQGFEQFNEESDSSVEKCIDVLQKQSLLENNSRTSRLWFHRLIKEYLLSDVPDSFAIPGPCKDYFWYRFALYYYRQIPCSIVNNVSTGWSILDFESPNINAVVEVMHSKTLAVELNDISMFTPGCVTAEVGLYKYLYIYMVRTMKLSKICDQVDLQHMSRYLVEKLRHHEIFIYFIDLYQQYFVEKLGESRYLELYMDALLTAHKWHMARTHSALPDILESWQTRVLKLYSYGNTNNSTNIHHLTQYFSALATSYVLAGKHEKFMENWRKILNQTKPLEACKFHKRSNHCLGLAYCGSQNDEKCIHYLEKLLDSTNSNFGKAYRVLHYPRYLVLLYHAYTEMGQTHKLETTVNGLYNMSDILLELRACTRHVMYRTCAIMVSFFNYLNTRNSRKLASQLKAEIMLHISLPIDLSLRNGVVEPSIEYRLTQAKNQCSLCTKWSYNCEYLYPPLYNTIILAYREIVNELCYKVV